MINLDLCASTLLVVGAFAVIATRGHARFERVDRAAPLPVVGRAPMHALYAVVAPVARILAAAGATANGVTLGSLVLALGAGAAFGAGHFGVGALLGALAGFADLIDGALARATGTVTRRGEILDTLTDRYSDAALLAGIAVHVRHDLALLLLTLAAWAGAFMVSFASSVLREHGARDEGARMRRAERMAWILGSAALIPFVERAMPGSLAWAAIAPVIVALGAIAVIANVSAVRRLLGTAVPPRAAPPAPSVRPPAPARLIAVRRDDRLRPEPRERVG